MDELQGADDRLVLLIKLSYLFALLPLTAIGGSLGCLISPICLPLLPTKTPFYGNHLMEWSPVAIIVIGEPIFRTRFRSLGHSCRPPHDTCRSFNQLGRWWWGCGYVAVNRRRVLTNIEESHFLQNDIDWPALCGNPRHSDTHTHTQPHVDE